MHRPHVLLTNDDGIAAPGLYALSLAMREIAEVSVVAPESERSAVSHALTIWDPVRIAKYEKNGEFFGYAIKGMPADCVKIACLTLLEKRPDLIISGINYGSNTGINVLYSGTVAAATEGMIMGIPSIAMSLTTFKNADFTYSARLAQRLAGEVLAHGLPPDTILNVNVPNVPESEITGIAITKMGRANFDDRYEKRYDPHDRPYYWLTGSKVQSEEGDDYDEGAIRSNLVSITPLHFDLTNHRFLAALSKWKL